MYLEEFKIVSVNEEWLTDKEKFVVEWIHHFINEREKSVEVAFIIFFDQLGYNWLRSLSFVKELPTVLVKDHMVFRLVKSNGETILIDLNKIKRDLEESVNHTYLELGKSLTLFFQK